MKYLIMRLTLFSAAILLFICAFSGCGLVKTGPQRDLDVALSKWEQSNIKNYEYQLRVNCFCPPNVTFPVIMKVSNGVNVSAEYAQEPKEITNDYFKQYDTIDKLFDVVQKSVDDKVASLIVEYDATYGYPRSITIDRIKDAIDDEIAFFVEAFIPAP
jgi:hypothetical protein